MVIGGSPAERAGLIAGDTVVKINNTDVYNLRHKDAQDVILRAGSAFDVTIQRGGSTWKPAVTPVGAISSPRPAASVNHISPVTATSLQAGRQESIGAIGTSHNVSAKPFHQINGGPKLVNKQYNSPLPIYSEQSIAETLSAQTEVLENGVLGVNFKKNERSYDSANSEVFRMVQEADKEPRDYDPVNRSDFYATHSHAIGGHSTAQQTTSSSGQYQTLIPEGTDLQQSEPEQKSSAVNQQITKCSDCEGVIVGVFVRIKDKNLHVECFKCSTCGTSLKNVGYYNLNNKLYCDVHAKLAARNNPPAPNLQPITVPPGGKIPSGTISAALSSHSLPSPSSLSPNTNYSAAPYQSSTNYSSPRAFSSVAAPLSPSSHTPKLSPISTPFTDDTRSNTTFSPRPGSLTPSMINKPPPVIPYYQSSLVATECTAAQTNIFDPTSPAVSRSPSPYPGRPASPFHTPSASIRPVSPAQGPPPNPLQSNTSLFAIKQEGKLQNARGHVQTFIPKHQNQVAGYHVTNPQPLKSPFLKSNVDTLSTKNDSDTHAQSKIPKKVVIPIHSEKPTTSNPNPSATTSSNQNVTKSCLSQPNAGTGGGRQAGAIGVAPKRGRGILNLSATPGSRVPLCAQCNANIRGPFITALGKIWCPDHFICAISSCRRPLQDLGFVQEQGQLYCEYCFEKYLAPPCSKCNAKIKGDCLKAIGRNFHPECFNCVYCGKLFGNSPFFLEDAQPYCEADWNELFTTKCFACGFPVEAGDRWVEALNNNYHSQCFNCTMCKKNLEGQSFFAKGGRPFCKNHAR
ncbi:hypothetical protein FQR65_LT13686 [Abscondita terminalis]|nr:hypothetical protein FQR65_LT13686 [Abscondita terminalis]